MTPEQAAIAFLTTTLFGFAGAVIRHLVNELAKANEKLDKSSDLVTRLTALVEKLS